MLFWHWTDAQITAYPCGRKILCRLWNPWINDSSVELYPRNVSAGCFHTVLSGRSGTYALKNVRRLSVDCCAQWKKSMFSVKLDFEHFISKGASWSKQTVYLCPQIPKLKFNFKLKSTFFKYVFVPWINFFARVAKGKKNHKSLLESQFLWVSICFFPSSSWLLSNC